MNYLFTGSRKWKNEDRIREELKKLKKGDLIIHGGARGTDSIVEKNAKELGIRTIVFRPEWERYGKVAALIRNKEMIEQNPDMVIAFIKGESRGTRHTIELAKKKGIKTKIIME